MAAALVVALVGCRGPADPAASTPTASTAAAPAAGFTNPVYETNFPDPMIFPGPDATFWAVATNGNGSNVQVATSTDLVTWEQGSDALPELAEWSTPGKVWAPEVLPVSRSRYVLYYTTAGPDPSIQCISAATTTRPAGPYVDRSTKPLVCDTRLGGSIDSHPFTAKDGTRYLYWKNDGNAIGTDTFLWVQRLDPSGTKLLGSPKRLLQQDLPWEGRLIEAPFVWEEGGRFHLFYSANAFDSADYAVGHAVGPTPLGPFTKTGDPILVTNDAAAGPGGSGLIERNGRVWMVYHAWPPDSVGSEIPGRLMWLSEVTFADDGSVSVVPPTVAYPSRP